jgi:large subunit ribosomal protein L1
MHFYFIKMGKVKLRVVGDEAAEQEQKEEQKKRREEKKQAKGLNMGGGQRINSVGVSEEDVMAQAEAEAKNSETAEEAKEGKKEAKKAGKKRKTKARLRSKRHSENTSFVAKKTVYPVSSGIGMLRKFKGGKFDESVELHINVKEKGISGQVALPHGTGKKLRIKVADDEVIAQVEAGKIEFDILVAHPSMMPKLAKVARVLGPRGLMPNPKAGTITDKPEALIEKLSKGQVSYKTEAQAPLIHMTVGKLTFEDKKLEENINSILSAIGSQKIDKVVLKSTMSPAIRIQV